MFAIYQILTGVGQHPQPKANPTQEKTRHLGHFFPQQIYFCGLGLILYRKQTTRNPTLGNRIIRQHATNKYLWNNFFLRDKTAPTR